jgi:hypothetical protein
LKRILAVFAGLMFCWSGWSQTLVVNGMVADSATMQPLGSVNLQMKNQLHGTTSNDKGYFSLSVQLHDTVIFTLVGYAPKHIAVKSILISPVIYLRELNTILKEITIFPRIELGLPKIPAESMFVNPTYKPQYTNTPGLPTIQTFGPSVIFKGVFSRFNKYEKEKKKLPKLQKANALAKTFLATVSDSVFVNEFIGLYHISREAYWDFLQVFNKKYGNSIYELPQDELISLLHLLYAETRKNGATK